MRWRQVIWLVGSVLLLTALLGWPNRMWRGTSQSPNSGPVFSLATSSADLTDFQLVTSQPIAGSERLAYRLSNTAQPLDRLAGNPHAILLENALLDTSNPTPLPIPDFLRSSGEPGAYIVQSRAAVDEAFRGRLQVAGVRVISYIPNNAFLVCASAGAARELAVAPGVGAVVAFEPYFKLKASLLRQAIEQTPGGGRLNVLLFPGERESATQHLRQLGLEIAGGDESPFGPVLQVEAPQLVPEQFPGLLRALAALPQVQEVEPATRRQLANDLSRTNLGVATTVISLTNYWGLTGTNIRVNLNDAGVDASHPDLAGRVVFDVPLAGVDTNGHGTHVAATIAGSGLQSASVTNASGSPMPASGGQFRGVAPGAKLLSLLLGGSDGYRQQTVARSNVFLSNNSWNYSSPEYDLAAASYDAAVRDSLPTMTGSQPVLYVFSAGNCGKGDDDGAGGQPGTILSPATAKNVITVGALEQPRQIASQVWACVTNGSVNCATNQPWLGMTDSADQIASFSSRGNVGIGIEGNLGRFKPDLVAPGTFVVSARSTTWDEAAYYRASNPSLIFPNFGNTWLVLSNLNRELGSAPCWYRYESGTSLAAAEVTGLLALMQECFEQRLGRTISPALMKALLINGARSLGNSSHFGVLTNAQGWGRAHLQTTLPPGLTNTGAGASIQWFDQNPALALATGQSHTRPLYLSPGARAHDLRLTLVWTDPPGNPVAGIKLVNDLDLVVTNLDTGAVYFGNDFQVGSDYVGASDTNVTPRVDWVNNVENIYLHGTALAPLGTNYSVTVRGRRVNVNALTARANVAQDYALVFSSGDGESTNTLTVGSLMSDTTLQLSTATNLPASGAGDVGFTLLGQRIGANSSLDTNAVLNGASGQITLGDTNQWRFYAVTNDTEFTNAMFVTFLPVSLSVPPQAVTNQAGTIPPARPDPDLDLFVSTDSGLTSLDSMAVANSWKSLGRGGHEFVLLNNAVPGVYYVGVKCESQQGAEYGLMAVFGEQPFNSLDADGNQVLRGVRVPQPIPDGTSLGPGQAYTLAVSPEPLRLHRIIVTNALAHGRMEDLVGTLTHQGLTAVLYQRNTSVLAERDFLFDDTEEHDVSGTEPTSGPGSLRDFAAQSSSSVGVWLLAQQDAVPGVTGTNLDAGLFLERQRDLEWGMTVTINPGSAREDYLEVPLAATNLSVSVNVVSSVGSLTAYVGRAGAAASACQWVTVSNLTTGTLTIDNTTHPPLSAGRYMLRLVNSGAEPVMAEIIATPLLDARDPVPSTFTASAATSIKDEAVSSASLFITNTDPIASVEVGVRLEHPRSSDLAIYLVSPGGTRVLLDENRGGRVPGGMGLNTVLTNTTPISSSGGPEAATNVVDTGQTSGILTIDYRFYSLPDTLRVYYDGALLFDSGLVSSNGVWTVNYSGNSTVVTIVMNEGTNDNTNTAWDYVLTSTRPGYIYATFTENTNLAALPIKLAIPPFNLPNAPPTSGIFYLPEESLDKLAGENPYGPWTLELWDTRAGGNDPLPTLLSWRLQLSTVNTVPKPIRLAHRVARKVTLPPGHMQIFTVAVPGWTESVTNLLLGASAPVNVFFNQNSAPTHTNQPGDVLLLANAEVGSVTLSPSTSPALVCGAEYYLGIQNAQTGSVTFEFEMDFQVAPLAAGMSLQTAVAPGPWPLYCSYDVSSNAAAVSFLLYDLTADAQLVASCGLPFPTLWNSDYVSSNAATADEAILVTRNSSPVPLAPGRWYVGIYNSDAMAATGALLATEISLSTNTISVFDCRRLTNNLCLTWSSTPGANYYVEGKTNLAGVGWTALSPALEAVDFQTGWCVPLGWGYLQIREEPVVVTNAPVAFSSITMGVDGVRLEWTATAGAQFQVQWTDSLSNATWNVFPDLITSPSETFWFLDDGSQSGGLTAPRFYRLVRVP